MEHITTFTGEDFTPLTPDINKIHIEDIAHALSLMCRANGHFDYFYSVAQHSINCVNEAKACNYSARIQMACLIHDASEAYISDITRPVKQHLHEYKIIEARLQSIIYEKYLGSNLLEDENDLIFQIDNNMLISEFNSLMSRKKVFTETPTIYSTPVFEYKDHKETETEFLKTYYGILHAGLIQGK